MTKTERMKKDIRQGKEYAVIVLKYNTTIDHVKNVASQMRRDGEKLPKRNSKEWKLIQFKRGWKEDVEEE